jgi:outer membrane lipoprotein-sorting protein
MELAALLELLYSASDRSRTVRAAIHRWNDHAREIDLLRARGLYRDPPPIPPEEGSWGAPDDVIESTTHLWAARPSSLRWETTFAGSSGANGASVGVKEGELFWHQFRDGEVSSNERREGGGTMSIEEERLLDPSPMLGTYRFDVSGTTAVLDRAAVEVVATRRIGGHYRDFGPLADELALLVDNERGVLLRVAVIVEGEEIAVTEIREIAFDESIQPERFRPLR